MSDEPTIEELEAHIAMLEEKIADEPRRIKEEQDRKLTMMPASDEIVQRERERTHRIEVTRGEVQNIRVTQAKDGVLLLFFLLGIVAIGFWIYNALQAM